MLWTKEQVLELIEMLHTSPSLWDISCREYRDRNLKYDEMSKMASHFQTNVDEISRKIKSLKTQFSRERKKIKDKTKSGAGTISEDNIWFGYKMMMFLSENNTSRGSRSTMEVGIYFYYPTLKKMASKDTHIRPYIIHELIFTFFFLYLFFIDVNS